VIYIARIYIFTAESMGPCLSVFTQLSLKFERSESEIAGKKTEFGIKYPLKGILGLSLRNQSQAGKGLHIAI